MHAEGRLSGDVPLTHVINAALRRDLARATYVLSGATVRRRRVGVARHLAWVIDVLGGYLRHDDEVGRLVQALRAACLDVVDGGDAAHAVRAIDELSAVLLPHLARTERTAGHVRAVDAELRASLRALPPLTRAAMTRWVAEGAAPALGRQRRTVVARALSTGPVSVMGSAVLHARRRHTAWARSPARRIPPLSPGDPPEPRRVRFDMVTHGEHSVLVPATPEQVYAVLSDPARVGEWSHETTGSRWRGQHREARPGAVFVGTNRVGALRWSMPCHIDEALPGRRLRYHTHRLRPMTEWEFELTPWDGGTRLVQRWRLLDIARSVEVLIHVVIPVHRDRTEALRADLVRLGEVAAREPTRPLPVG